MSREKEKDSEGFPEQREETGGGKCRRNRATASCLLSKEKPEDSLGFTLQRREAAGES